MPYREKAAAADRSRSMSKGNKRWIALAGVALLVVAIAVGRNRRAPPDDGADGANVTDLRTAGGRLSFPNNTGGGDNTDGGAAADGARAVASGDPPAEKQIETLMSVWRNAIVNKDADAVVAADGSFRHEPQKFREALMKSAETDADDRVRAFSTRVLGKFVDPVCAPLFTRLLGDK